MKKYDFLAIVLAAGRGSRMGTVCPKVMHEVGGLPMIHHVFHAISQCSDRSPCLVTAPDMEGIREESPFSIHAIQDQPKGTGHAVMAAESVIREANSDILILCGDTPLIQAGTLRMIAEAGLDHDLVLVGSYVDHPNSYGRLILDEDQNVVEILEAHECDEGILEQHTLCNAGFMYIKNKHIFGLLGQLNNQNQKQEYYLTDVVQLARAAHLSVGLVEAPHEEVFGVNTLYDLSMAEFLFQQEKRAHFLSQGVLMTDPESVYFSYDTKIAPDVKIEPHVFFGPGVSIKQGVHVKAFSHIEGTVLDEGCVVGPFARLRPETTVGPKAKVGNFVEIKKSSIGAGAKVSHLSYVGDTDMGQGVNVGAGTITCNYDGRSKHKTKIGDHTFIGSNTALVAPLTIGEGALIGAGSVITKDVAGEALSLSRSSQMILPGQARKFLDPKKK